MIEVHKIPEDNTVLFRVSPPLEVAVTNTYLSWETNQMWVQVKANRYFDSQPDRLEGSVFDRFE